LTPAPARRTPHPVTDKPADRNRTAGPVAPETGKAAREARLALALRANLSRRKAAARAAQAGGATGGSAGDDDPGKETG
jgi:hypothetical protein